MDGTKFVRFLLTFFFGFIGSFIINHNSLKPKRFKSRTMAYFFLGIINICNLAFDDEKTSNIGYKYKLL